MHLVAVVGFWDTGVGDCKSYLQQERMIMDVRRKTRVKRDWSVIFEEFHRSGLSIKEFCRAEGMSQSLFYRRRKDYGDADKSAKSPLRRGDFIELKRVLPASARPSAAIVFGSQVELSISNHCDKELLRLIISQLKGSSC